MGEFKEGEIEAILQDAFRPHDCRVALKEKLFLGFVYSIKGRNMFPVRLVEAEVTTRADLAVQIRKIHAYQETKKVIFDAWSMPAAGGKS